MPRRYHRELLLVALLACTSTSEGPQTSPEETPVPDDEVPDVPTTAEDLDAFYGAHGGRDAFPAHHVDALEALLYAQDDLEAGSWDAARTRVDDIFDAMPLSDPIWRQDVGYAGLNIGDPVAYYGLRMLDQILDLGEQPSTGTLQLTAVVATCADVTRPTLPDLTPETVRLDIAPEILADDARRLRVSTDLFRHWVRAISGGRDVTLVVHPLTDCTTVDYTDDGDIIVSYPDADAMVRAVPDDIASVTDMWWVVAPSGVPGDGSGYDRHFITGGMGGFGAGLPLFLSDDAWFTRKPEHLGEGPYSEIELRAYQPQWFQHEFMHHLFRTWPALALEVTSHQWFDRTTWPADFVGVWEPDYYAEALTKRLLLATPSIADALTAPEPFPVEDLEPDALLGNYERQPVLNDWHETRIERDGDQLWWRNAAGAAWTLDLRDDGLWSGADCPYGEQAMLIEATDGVVTTVWFNGEDYVRVP